MTWKLAEAKNMFSEFLRSGPGFEGVDLERDTAPMRDIE